MSYFACIWFMGLECLESGTLEGQERLLSAYHMEIEGLRLDRGSHCFSHPTSMKIALSTARRDARITLPHMQNNSTPSEGPHGTRRPCIVGSRLRGSRTIPLSRVELLQGIRSLPQNARSTHPLNVLTAPRTATTLFTPSGSPFYLPIPLKLTPCSNDDHPPGVH